MTSASGNFICLSHGENKYDYEFNQIVSNLVHGISHINLRKTLFLALSGRVEERRVVEEEYLQYPPPETTSPSPPATTPPQERNSCIKYYPVKADRLT